MKTNPVLKSVCDSAVSVEVFPGRNVAAALYIASLSPTGFLISKQSKGASAEPLVVSEVFGSFSHSNLITNRYEFSRI